jgi:hypothetical protein
VRSRRIYSQDRLPAAKRLQIASRMTREDARVGLPHLAQVTIAESALTVVALQVGSSVNDRPRHDRLGPARNAAARKLYPSAWRVVRIGNIPRSGALTRRVWGR